MAPTKTKTKTWAAAAAAAAAEKSSSRHSRSSASAGAPALGAAHVLLVCPGTSRFELALVGYDPDDQPSSRTLLDSALERCEDGEDSDDDDDGASGGGRTGGLADPSLYSGELCRPDPGAEVMIPSRPIATYGVGGGAAGDADLFVAIPAGMSAFEAVEIATPILMENWAALLRRSRAGGSDDDEDGEDEDGEDEDGGGEGAASGVGAKTLLKKASDLLAEVAEALPVKERASVNRALWRDGDEISLTPRQSVAWQGTTELVVDATGDDGGHDNGGSTGEERSVPVPRPLHEGLGPWIPPHPQASPRPPLLKGSASAPGPLRDSDGRGPNKEATVKSAAVATFAASVSSKLSKVSDDVKNEEGPEAGSADGRATKGNARRTKSRKARRGRLIRFDSVTIREYPMILGDHPNVSYGPPVTLGWDYDEYEPLSLDVYESCHPTDGRRSMRQMMMNYYRRKNVLSFWAGYTEEELKAAHKSVKRDKRRRSLTLNVMPAMRCYETALGIKAFALGGKKRRARKGSQYYEKRVMAVMAETEAATAAVAAGHERQ